MTDRRLRPLFAAALVSCVLVGCEDSGSGGGSPSMIFGSADTTREKAEAYFRSFIPSETDKR